MSNITERIKNETKAAHQELEKKVVLLLKEIKTDADYAHFLKYFYSYFETLERGFSPFITDAVLEDVSTRRDAKYLRDDIESLGAEAQAFEIVSTPQIDCLAKALGAMYVREGSTMGGSIIVDMLAKRGVKKGTSFFAGYGSQTGQRWQLFQQTIVRSLTTDQEQDQAVKAAKETFAHFGQLFDRYEKSPA